MPAAPRDYAVGLHHLWVNATGNWPYYVDVLAELGGSTSALRDLVAGQEERMIVRHGQVG